MYEQHVAQINFLFLELYILKMVASFPGPAPLSVARKNAEGLVCFLTCVTSRVERW